MMIKFSKIFTEGFMKDSLVQLITWEDVLLLLTTKNHDQLAFYLTLRINKGSTKDLETAMSGSMHLNSKKEKQNRNQTLELSKQISIERLTPEMLSKNDMQETNMFKEPVCLNPTSGWETEFAKGLRRSNGDVSNLFTSNQLRAMRQYAADFSNIDEASQLASLLTWEHILILLSAN